MPVTTIPLLATATPPLPLENSVPSVKDTDLFPALPVSANTLSNSRASIPAAYWMYDRSLPEPPDLYISCTTAFNDFRSGLIRVETYSHVLQKGNSDTQCAGPLYANVRGFPRFLELPSELRERVYEFDIETQPTSYCGIHTLERQVSCVRRASVRYSQGMDDLPPVCNAISEALPV
jgi:hypothetical protein